MKLTNEQLKILLVGINLISSKQFEIAEKEAKEKHIPLLDYLPETGFINKKYLGQIVAGNLGFNYIDLENRKIDKKVLSIVPEIVARNRRIIVFDKTKDGLMVAMADPSDFEMREWLERKTGEKIIPYYTTYQDIKDALRYYRKGLKKTFEEIIKEQAELVKLGKVKAGDLPIIKIVDTLIEYAYENRASDIHIEPLEEETQVRFRIDGILHNVLTLPKDIHNLIVTRIKVLSKLRTDEHFAAQDGKFSAEFSGEKFDVRVSIVPITGGENVVMRILSERSRHFSLENLGLSEENFKKVKSAIKKPYGMILTTGPTGSGKTTTLYAILRILNRPEVNIMTVEDPVEYDMQGVNQIQVNPKTNLTFANGLRSIVRQDPDIIMVGEIRDSETAEIAVNAAMTGHLVLSTMHANDTATGLVRLMEIGIEPFLVASSVNVILAQRLVRKICTKCRESYEVKIEEMTNSGLSNELIEKIFKGREKVRLYKGKGCESCVNTGYSGRIGIFEVLEMEDDIRKLVVQKANADKIREQSVKNGMTVMIEDGIKKVLAGITTIEEIIRVTKE